MASNPDEFYCNREPGRWNAAVREMATEQPTPPKSVTAMNLGQLRDVLLYSQNATERRRAMVRFESMVRQEEIATCRAIVAGVGK